MRTTQTITISLPPAMALQIEEVRKLESRTCSELIREALRTYFESRYPAVPPTRSELAALRRGRAAVRRGDVLSLSSFLHGLESPNQRSRAKGVQGTSAKRAGAR